MAGVNTAKTLTPNEARIGLLIQLAVWCFVGGAVGLVAHGPLFYQDLSIRDAVKDIFGHPDVEMGITTAQSLLVVTYILGFFPLVAVLIACVLFVLLCRQKRALRTQVLGAILLISALALFTCGVAVLAIAHNASSSWSDDSDRNFDDMKTGILSKYGVSETHRRLTEGIDKVQIRFECCGVDNVTDFWASQWKTDNERGVPESCCKIDANQNHTVAMETCAREAEDVRAHVDVNSTVLQTEGCRGALEFFIGGHIFHNLVLSGSIAAVLAVVVIILVIAIIVLSVLESRTPKHKLKVQEVETKVQTQALL